jgi:hypothetical protein
MSGLRVLLCTMAVLSAAMAFAEDAKVTPEAAVTNAALRPVADARPSRESALPVMKASLPEGRSEAQPLSADPALDQDETNGLEKWMLEYGRTLSRAE